MFKRHFILAAVAASVAFGATNALAESNQVTGIGALNATANLDFQVNIPGVLRLRIGTDAATVDLITFNVPFANIGDGSNVAGTGGDLGGGQVTVELFGNRGAITLTPTVPANLTDGGTDTIPYTEILVAATTGDAGGGLAPNGANLGVIASRAVPLTAGSKVTNRTDTWTFTFDNTAAYAAGTYGGVNTNGSRVLWTAAMP